MMGDDYDQFLDIDLGGPVFGLDDLADTHGGPPAGNVTVTLDPNGSFAPFLKTFNPQQMTGPNPWMTKPLDKTVTLHLKSQGQAPANFEFLEMESDGEGDKDDSNPQQLFGAAAAQARANKVNMLQPSFFFDDADMVDITHLTLTSPSNQLPKAAGSRPASGRGVEGGRTPQDVKAAGPQVTAPPPLLGLVPPFTFNAPAQMVQSVMPPSPGYAAGGKQPLSPLSGGGASQADHAGGVRASARIHAYQTGMKSPRGRWVDILSSPTGGVQKRRKNVRSHSAPRASTQDEPESPGPEEKALPVKKRSSKGAQGAAAKSRRPVTPKGRKNGGAQAQAEFMAPLSAVENDSAHEESDDTAGLDMAASDKADPDFVPRGGRCSGGALRSPSRTPFAELRRGAQAQAQAQAAGAQARRETPETPGIAPMAGQKANGKKVLGAIQVKEERPKPVLLPPPKEPLTAREQDLAAAMDKMVKLAQNGKATDAKIVDKEDTARLLPKSILADRLIEVILEFCGVMNFGDDDLRLIETIMRRKDVKEPPAYAGPAEHFVYALYKMHVKLLEHPAVQRMTETGIARALNATVGVEDKLVKNFRSQLQGMAKRTWIRIHYFKPYITTENKKTLAAYTGETGQQIMDYLTNWRARAWRREIREGAEVAQGSGQAGTEKGSGAEGEQAGATNTKKKQKTGTAKKGHKRKAHSESEDEDSEEETSESEDSGEESEDGH